MGIIRRLKSGEKRIFNYFLINLEFPAALRRGFPLEGKGSENRRFSESDNRYLVGLPRGFNSFSLLCIEVL